MRAHERGDKKTRTGAEERENRCMCVCARACVWERRERKRDLCVNVCLREGICVFCIITFFLNC